MSLTSLLKEIWEAIYNPQLETSTVIDKFFHPHYEQCINGIKMNRDEYIHHVCEQKKNIIIEKIDYIHVLEKENELFALYYPKGKNIKNLPIEGEVIAYFLFEDKKILKIHGQVHLLKGNEADVDMQ